MSTGKTYVKDTLAVGKLVYTDRSYTYTTVPAGYVGAEYIRTANNDRGATNADYVRFQLAAAGTVYVAYDARATSLPAWLSGWTETGDVVGTSDGDRRVYAQEYGAGEVVLGGNSVAPMADAGSNYSVIAVPAGASWLMHTYVSTGSHASPRRSRSSFESQQPRVKGVPEGSEDSGSQAGLELQPSSNGLEGSWFLALLRLLLGERHVGSIPNDRWPDLLAGAIASVNK